MGHRGRRYKPIHFCSDFVDKMCIAVVASSCYWVYRIREAMHRGKTYRQNHSCNDFAGKRCKEAFEYGSYFGWKKLYIGKRGVSKAEKAEVLMAMRGSIQLFMRTVRTIDRNAPDWPMQ